MENTSFINDGINSSSDESKLIYHFMRKEVDKYLTRRMYFINILIFFAVIMIVGILSLENYEDIGIGIAGIGGGVTVMMLIFLFTNRVKIKINKLGLVYLPFSQIKFQKGSILIDRSGFLKEQILEFVNLSPENIKNANNQYKSLQNQINEMPSILSHDKTMGLKNSNDEYRKENIKMYKEEVNYLEINNKLEEIFSQTLDFNVNLKVFENEPIFLKKLNDLQNGKPNNIIYTIDEEQIKNNIQKIDGIVEMYNNKESELVDIDDLCVETMELINTSFPRLDYTVNQSLNEIIVPSTYMYTDIIEKASYNSYCPYCNEEIIEKLLQANYKHNGKLDNRAYFKKNTQMELVDIDNGMWECPLCNTTTQNPFLKHKLEDELFTPVYDKLYEENYKDRLAIYNHINDEKRKYTEKAESLFHEVLRESRTKSDIIKSKIRTVTSEVIADEMAVRDLKDLLIKYKKMALDKSQEIENDLRSHKENIMEENKKSKARLNDISSTAVESIEESTNRNALLEREDQAKRDAVQREISKNTEGIKHILHADAKSRGVIKDKSRWRKAIDSITDKETEPGLTDREYTD